MCDPAPFLCVIHDHGVNDGVRVHVHVHVNGPHDDDRGANLLLGTVH